MFSLVLEAWTQVYVGVADLDDSVDGPQEEKTVSRDDSGGHGLNEDAGHFFV